MYKRPGGKSDSDRECTPSDDEIEAGWIHKHQHKVYMQRKCSKKKSEESDYFSVKVNTFSEFFLKDIHP